MLTTFFFGRAAEHRLRVHLLHLSLDSEVNRVEEMAPAATVVLEIKALLEKPFSQDCCTHYKPPVSELKPLVGSKVRD